MNTEMLQPCRYGLKVSLFTKGLRPIIKSIVNMAIEFESFPVYEGIKTARLFLVAFASVFESFPVYEGIKTSRTRLVRLVFLFESFPVYEGIKTTSILQPCM